MRRTASRMLFAAAISGCRQETAPFPAVDPGAPLAAHLTPSRYENTVRELFGTEEEVTAAFPEDGQTEDFDHIGEASITTMAHASEWEAAAAALTDEMFGLVYEQSGNYLFEVEDGALFDPPSEPASGVHLWRSGRFSMAVTLPWDGRYTLSLVGAGYPNESPPLLSIAIDGRFASIETFGSEGAQITVWIDEGSHTVEGFWLNAGSTPIGERAITLDRLELEGPLDAEGQPRPSRDGYLPCDEIDRSCAQTAIERFGRRAWRKPLTDTDVAWAIAVYDSAISTGDPSDSALSDAFRAILLAPDFLFPLEPDGPKGERLLDDHELGARLAAFLWSSTPDETLLAEADAGALHTDGELQDHTERMLADPRASGLVRDFGGQWLGIRALDAALPDPKTFPGFDPSLRASLHQQLELRAGDFLAGRIDSFELLTSTDSWMNERLAQFEGLPPPDEGWTLRPLSGRPGWLTSAGWLAGQSHPTSPSAVRRGYWVLEKLLCSEPPPPPPVLELPDTTAGDTVREREESLRGDPSCQACHGLMDPIGFVLSGFDAIGAPQQQDTLGEPIDTRAVLDGIIIDDPAALAEWIAADPRLPRCVVHQTLTYALQRPLRPEDDAVIDELTGQFLAGGVRFPALAGAITASELFRWRATSGVSP